MRTTLRRIGLPLALLVGLLVAHGAADAATSATRSATIKAKWEDPAYRANVFKGRFGGNSPQAKKARAEGQWANPLQAAQMIIARHGAAAPSLDKVYEAVKAQYGGNSTEARSLRGKMMYARRAATATPAAAAIPAAIPETPAVPVAEAPAAAAARFQPRRSGLASWALRGRLAPIASRVVLSRSVKQELDAVRVLASDGKFDDAFARLPKDGLTLREQMAVEILREQIHRARDARVGAPVE